MFHLVINATSSRYREGSPATVYQMQINYIHSFLPHLTVWLFIFIPMFFHTLTACG